MLFIEIAQTWAVQRDSVNTAIIHSYSTIITILHGSSYGFTLRSQHTRPHSVLRCLSSSNWLLLSLRRSATVADSHVWHCSIRIYPYRPSSSNNISPSVLSCHNSNIPSRACLAGFQCRLGSPCFRSVWNCCQHRPYAFGFALVEHLHCVPTHLVHYDHRAYLPPCTTSCYQRAYSLTHSRGSPLQGSSTIS